MFLMDRLVSRSSRSLAVMIGAATPGQGTGGDDVRRKRRWLGFPSCRSRSSRQSSNPNRSE
jgi:hypothetical protein